MGKKKFFFIKLKVVLLNDVLFLSMIHVNDLKRIRIGLKEFMLKMN